MRLHLELDIAFAGDGFIRLQVLLDGDFVINDSASALYNTRYLPDLDRDR